MGSREDRDGLAYSFCFFLGPGLFRTLTEPSPFPAIAAADRLAPFFFGPSAGGPMTEAGAGVPPAAGVPGVESDAFSGFEAGAAGSVFEVAGESLAGEGESSLTAGGGAAGSTIARSFSGDTVMVIRPDD